MDKRPIGIFDSGVGGLSVLRELADKLPFEHVIYFADSLNCPYGTKSKEEVIILSRRIVDFLLSQEVKLIIIACNTATAAAIDHLRKLYNIPFVGMEPAIKPAALTTKTGNIAVLATEGTFKGRHFIETSQNFAKGVKVEILIGEGLVEIVENNKHEDPIAIKQIEKVLNPIKDKNIDKLVLGCTHYPLLIESISKAVNKQVEIINPAPAVIKQTHKLLDIAKQTNNSTEKPSYTFYSNGELHTLKKLAEQLLNKKQNMSFQNIDL